MSIYCSLWEIQIPDEDRGGSFEGAWREVWAQGVPGHINEQNGYSGPGWDEWLPAFVHDDGCQMRTSAYQTKQGPRPWHECDCSFRAVFICDDLTKKGTQRNGQEYVNPVLVLSGPEYLSITFTDLLERIEDAVAERRGRQLCLAPECTLPATVITTHRGDVIEARCDEHEQQQRRPAGQDGEDS